MDIQLQAHIEQLATLSTEALQAHAKAREVFAEFKYKLNLGQIRAAEKLDGVWKVNHWVKQGILLGFRLGEMKVMPSSPPFSFVDKDTYPTRQFSGSEKNTHCTRRHNCARRCLSCAKRCGHAASLHQCGRLC